MTDSTPAARDHNAAEEVHLDGERYRLFGKLRVHDPAAPTILLLHGLGFHSFEYDELARRLADARFNSLALDFRCHGLSEGPRSRWTLLDLVDDADRAVKFLSQRLRGGIGIFGNSLGAIVGVYVAGRNSRVESLVASNCPTRVADFAATDFRRLLLTILRGLEKMVPLRVSVNHFIPYNHILRKPEIIDRVRHDPLITDARRFAPSTYADMFGWNALTAITKLRVPLLVLYAMRDELQSPEQSHMLFDAARCEKEMRAVDTGHVPDLEDPALLAPILIDWFRRTLCR